jgi:N-methylhydantoinase A
MNSRLRIGIDVGGTFTDLVALDEDSGETILMKFPSTPHDPSAGVIEAFKSLMAKTKGDEEIALFVHASTIGTNLFLGQSGLRMPKAALITTSGFKDILEIGRQRRAELYNPFFERPEPLIERHFRFTVHERIDYQGRILKHIDEEEVKTLGKRLKEEGVEAVAIVFLHSYINPQHERRVKEILGQELSAAILVASYEVDPEYREYERTSTTVVNSLLIPVVSEYLKKIEKKLKELDVHAPFYIMQSNGGLTNVNAASRIPVSTIESGPATGVIASAYWSKMLGLENILSFDMGGTTAKAGSVIQGKPNMVHEYEVGGTVHSGRTVKGSGYPVRYPFIDLAEVSAGGGTIAWVDEDGALRVGPLSAGSDPGPACYGKGGEHPTVTDANLVLRRLSSQGLSSGEMKVFPELAEKALKEKIADLLGISLIQAAHGILEIVNNHMTRALRLISIEKGYDPRDFSMLAFGGAGPMHAPFLAEGLGVSTVFIPLNPGVFSAQGLILMDFRHDFKRAVMKKVSEIDLRFMENIFMEMETEAMTILKKEGFTSKETVLEKYLDLRYLEQSYDIQVPVQKNLNETLTLFHHRHHETYGYAVYVEPVEIVNIHLVAWGLIRKPDMKKISPANTTPSPEALKYSRKVFFEKTEWIDTPIYLRYALLPGNRIKGPAIIDQYDTTIIIPPEWDMQVDGFSNLCLKRG